MRILNPFKINDWGIREYIVLMIVAHSLMLLVNGFYLGGLDLPVFREAVGFIYLAFIPGFIILRLLKIHRLNPVENILYCVGLSVVFLMLAGFLINVISPYFGWSSPLGTLSLVTTIVTSLAALTAWSYYRDKGFSAPDYLNVGEILSPPTVFLLLLPLLSIIGTHFVNYYHSNIVLMILIALVALVVVLIVFNVFIPRRLYPLAVFSIALSLFYHLSLISPYLTGADIKVEYYVYGLTNQNLFWDWTLPNQSNSVLSVTILPVTYSSLSGIEGTWVFKAIFPFLFALVPLGLYSVYERQSDDKTAFLASFYLVSLNAHQSSE